MRIVFLTTWLAATNLFGAQTKVRLLLSADSAKPGETIFAAVQMQMPLNWHTYWRNPGDSGSPTTIEWTLPEGITAGEILWPVPFKDTVPAGDEKFITYVYDNESTLLIPLKISGTISAGEKNISAKIAWQECETVCVLGKTDVRAKLSVGAEHQPSAQLEAIEEAQKKLPATNAPFAVISSLENLKGDTASLSIQISSSVRDEFDFFPYSHDKAEISGGTISFSDESGVIILRKTIQKKGRDWPKEIHGLLVQKVPGEENSRGYEIVLSLKSVPAVTVTATDPTAPTATRSLFAILGFAFLGGLILNIMPCVLPIIALKIFSFVQQGKESPQRVKTLGLVYGLG
ncbi:MAG: protein-disulfide reductase DsbD domain-containing protein, partial [Verrucomicrobiota bacterium]